MILEDFNSRQRRHEFSLWELPLNFTNPTYIDVLLADVHRVSKEHVYWRRLSKYHLMAVIDMKYQLENQNELGI